MKSLVLLLLAIAVLVFIGIQVFQNGFRHGVESVGIPSAPEYRSVTTTPGPQVSNTGTSGGGVAPTNFQGPSGPPHIVGPSAPPPNY